MATNGNPQDKLIGLEAAIIGYLAHERGNDFIQIYESYVSAVKDIPLVQRRDYFIKVYEAYNYGFE